MDLGFFCFFNLNCPPLPWCAPRSRPPTINEGPRWGGDVFSPVGLGATWGVKGTKSGLGKSGSVGGSQLVARTSSSSFSSSGLNRSVILTSEGRLRILRSLPVRSEGWGSGCGASVFWAVTRDLGSSGWGSGSVVAVLRVKRIRRSRFNCQNPM